MLGQEEAAVPAVIPRRRGAPRHTVWQHFEEVASRSSAGSHATAQCNYCSERLTGQPKAKMIPHLLRKCSRVPEAVVRQLQEAPAVAAVSATAEAASDVESVSASGGLEAIQGLRPETQLARLELLRLKAKVAKYQAKAMEAQFMAETLAARITLQGIGVPDNEIDRGLPPL